MYHIHRRGGQGRGCSVRGRFSRRTTNPSPRVPQIQTLPPSTTLPQAVVERDASGERQRGMKDLPAPPPTMTVPRAPQNESPFTLEVLTHTSTTPGTIVVLPQQRRQQEFPPHLRPDGIMEALPVTAV